MVESTGARAKVAKCSFGTTLVGAVLHPVVNSDPSDYCSIIMCVRTATVRQSTATDFGCLRPSDLLSLTCRSDVTRRNAS